MLIQLLPKDSAEINTFSLPIKNHNLVRQLLSLTQIKPKLRFTFGLLLLASLHPDLDEINEILDAEIEQDILKLSQSQRVALQAVFFMNKGK